jgi:DtxR family transcriptional regulator, Mn-dependent transcriptional regulator
MAELHDATEEYLETIFEIEEEGITPIRARLVERLGLSAPAVSETVQRLVDHDLVELNQDRSLSLTETGRELATRMVRRHRLAERLLSDVIGLEWEKVHKEACRWEHVISDDVETKLIELLGDPTSCPHGNPIPSKSRRTGRVDTTPLWAAPVGPVNVIRILEHLELDDDALSLLGRSRLIPGEAAEVLDRRGDTLRVRTSEGETKVPRSVAESVLVAAL